MPPGFSARCAACSSPHRPEIDRRLLAGEPTRTVSAWLAEQGEQISYSGLGRHKRDHLAVAETVATLAAQAAPAFDSAVQEQLNDLAMHQEEAIGGHQLSMLVRTRLREKVEAGESVPMSLVALYKACEDAARKHAEAVRGIRDGGGSERSDEWEEAIAHLEAGAESAHDLLRGVAQGLGLARLPRDVAEPRQVDADEPPVLPE